MANTSRTIFTKPTVPTLGAAPYLFTDPTFGTRMVRVTDANFTATANQSFHTSASSYQRTWNADNTKFIINASDGNFYVVTFNAATLATAKWGGALPIGGPDMVWSDTNPNLIYAIGTQANHHTIITIDVTTTTFTTAVFLDLDTVTPGMDSTSFVGSISLAGGNLFCIYGASQDTHRYCLWYPLANPAAKLVCNTMTRAGLVGTLGADIHFGMHSAQIDKAGRFISLIPWGSTVNAYMAYIWDTTLDTVTAVTANSSGHEVLGFGTRVNNDSKGTYDAFQWVYTPDLTAPNTNKVDIITPLLTPQLVFSADHACWNHATVTDPTPPFVSAHYRYDVNDVTAWRAWDDEIVSVSVTGPCTVYRHCHHRSRTLRETPVEVGPPLADIFWYTPRPNVSRDGKWIAFTSNWEKSIGTEVGTLIARQDVFICERVMTSRTKHRRFGR